MVLYVLYAKAELEGVETLSLVPGSDICVSVRNTTQDQKRERIVVEAELHEADVPEHEKHRSEHASNFALTWEGEHTRSTIRIVEGGGDNEKGKGSKKRSNGGDGVVTREITARDDGQFVPILKLECDGLEPYAFHPMGKEFSLVNSGGAKIENVDLSTGEWSEYDLASGSFLVKNFETKFE